MTNDNSLTHNTLKIVRKSPDDFDLRIESTTGKLVAYVTIRKIAWAAWSTHFIVNDRSVRPEREFWFRRKALRKSFQEIAYVYPVVDVCVPRQLFMDLL